MAKEPKAVAGPDNNKRLAILEAGVSSLAVALVGAGVPLKEGEDPVLRATAFIESAKLFADRIAELEPIAAAFSASTDKLIAGLEAAGIAVPEGADLDALILDAIAKGPDTASDGEVAAIARAEKAETALGAAKIELQGAIEDLDTATSEKNKAIEERNAAIEALEEKPGFLDKIRSVLGRKDPDGEEAAPIAGPRERPEAARDLGPSFCKIGDEEFAELMAEDAELEIAFSNGTYELISIGPVTIKASDLMVTGGRRIVSSAVLIRGGDYQEQLHGAGLLYQGEQIHYCQFPDPIPIEAGQERQFVKALYFG